MRSTMHTFMWLWSGKDNFPDTYAFWSFKDLSHWSWHKHFTIGLPQTQQMRVYVFPLPSFCPPQCWWCVTVHSAKCKMIMVMTMWHHHYPWWAVTGARREREGGGGSSWGTVLWVIDYSPSLCGLIKASVIYLCCSAHRYDQYCMCAQDKRSCVCVCMLLRTHLYLYLFRGAIKLTFTCLTNPCLSRVPE